MEARLHRVAELRLPFGEDVERPHQVLAREPRRDGLELLLLPFRGNLRVVQPRGIDRHHQQIAGEAAELAQHRAQLVTALDGALDGLEDRRAVLARHRRDHLDQQFAAHQAEHRGDVLRRDRRTGERDHLIEGALRVAHAALACPRNQHHRRVVDGDVLGGGDRLQLLGDRLHADGLQLEHLRARLDRRRHLVDLGRRHHEDDVRGRFFDRLEQRVEGLGGEAVHFVDDEDLVAVAHRRHAEAGDDDLADLVDLRVGGGVDLEHVHVAPFGDLDAGVADAAGIGGRALFAVEAPRQDARRGGLADAARAGEHEGLGDAAAGDGVAQRLRDGALADHVFEALGPPLPGENLVRHRCVRVRRDVRVRGLEKRSRTGPTATRRRLRHISVTA